ncbi:hypothetical protein P154DRAFT_474211 [Amniculicola lignicola CBS 123094]|uniref:Uncharacterized protein n=1 Tax=Amniculicola lignicola CBS 123094 TaxID=1392246 RepID=A0A6A5W2K6_9PLEO|nr:hypothetical protein P154DRAFT_474211 [Amniculicola lignicola CBS 123094]
MRFFTSSRKADPGKLPTQEPKPLLGVTTTISGARKDSGITQNTSRALPKTTSPKAPLPARTTSTRFHSPTQSPNQSPTSSAHRPSKKYTTMPKDKEKAERPGLQRRRTTAHTRYIDMLLGLDTVPKLHNFLASFFTWILLAGYIVFPATFNKFQKDKSTEEKGWKGEALKTVKNVPLLYIAIFACAIGGIGCLWLWWRWRKNYVWVINRIFLPALMNSIAGLISTLVNVYSTQDGQYSVTAKSTIIVTSGFSVVAAALFLIYNSIMLMLVKKRHDRETREVHQDVV